MHGIRTVVIHAVTVQHHDEGCVAPMIFAKRLWYKRMVRNRFDPYVHSALYDLLNIINFQLVAVESWRNRDAWSQMIIYKHSKGVLMTLKTCFCCF